MINIAIVGLGFAGALHLEAYDAIPMKDAVLYAACEQNPQRQALARQYGISKIYEDYGALLKDPNVDVVDIITPPIAHEQMIIEALAAGKDVICEKPLTGFFAPAVSDGREVPRAQMRQKAEESLDRIGEALARSGRLLMYAENFVYAPAVQKCAEFLRVRKDKVLMIKGEESHSGSHAEHARYWQMNGGGALIRQGCHPLSAAIYLKSVEASARGETLRPVAVSAVTRQLSASLSEVERRYIVARPSDVEDFAHVSVTLSDGSVCLILSCDNVVGGVRNVMEVYTSAGNYQCPIAPNNGMTVFHESEEGLENVYITEKLGHKAGWQPVFLEENVMRGYQGELRDFIACVRDRRAPQSGYALARETIRLIYAAYQSAFEGRVVTL